jgi:hypothetical protein
MLRSLKRWRPATLLASWVVYWLLLAVFGLGPAIAAIWRAAHGGNGQSDVRLSFTNGLIKLVVTVAGHSTYSGSIHLLVLGLLIGLPPLVLWSLWLAQRPHAAGREQVA